MNELALELVDNRTAFLPEEEVIGKAAWRLAEAPTLPIEVNLLWHTSGDSTPDVGIADQVQFAGAAAQEMRGFRLRLPSYPYSVDGVNFDILWAIEIVLPKSELSQRIEITMSPNGQPIVLEQAPRELDWEKFGIKSWR